jgi:hypothetical protein
MEDQTLIHPLRRIVMATAMVDRQVARVRWRLLLGALLRLLPCSWAGALALSAGWFLVQPLLLPEAPEALRWYVLGGLAGVATVAVVIVGWLRRPSAVSAALSLDERFNLKERVVTSLTLTPTEATTPAGQALLADVDTRLAPLRVGEKFPVAMPWKPAALVPAAAAVLALVVLFWNPDTGHGQGDEPDPIASNPEVKRDLKKKLQQLAARPKAKKEEEPKSPELEKINADVERFARQPHDTRDDVRDRIKDATRIEDMIRKEQKQQAERVDAFKEQMKQVERLSRKNRQKEGPANKADEALAQGDFDRAKGELERLSRKVEKDKKREEEKERLKKKQKDKNLTDLEREKARKEQEKLDREPPELSQKEREELEKQLEDMKDKLERLSRKKEDQLAELEAKAQKGEIDKEQLDREKDQLEKNCEQLARDQKDIQELAEKLGECEQCMKEGKDGEAAKKLAQAAKKAGQMSKTGQAKQLARQLKQVQEVKKAMCKAVSGGPGVASGRRPISKDKDDTGSEEKRVRGELDKGKLDAVGTGPVGGFKGPRKPTEMTEEIRQAAQEAPAAIDRQRLPQSAKKMARGYFERVRGKDLGKKPEK